MDNIIEALNWRYATKQFDSSKKLSAEQFETLLETARLSPSSYGLPTWKVINVESKEIRQKLREAGYNQAQFTDASHVLVFASVMKIDDELVHAFIENLAKERGMEVKALEQYSNTIKGVTGMMTQDQKRSWAEKQAYIGMGMILLVAAENRIDACPIEGFDKAKFDEILGLSEEGLTSAAVIALGFRDEKDAFAVMKKVRPKPEEFIIKK